MRLTAVLLILAAVAVLAPAQTQQTPVQFEYTTALMPTEVSFTGGAPVFSNYQGGIMLQAWTRLPDVNAFVAMVAYKLAGTDKVLHKQMYFPRTPGSEHGSTSATFGVGGLDFEVHSIIVLGVKQISSVGILRPEPGKRYLIQ